MKINLSKEKALDTVKICLSKAGYADNVKAKVCLAVDGSGSMRNLYLRGYVQALVDRALAVGFHFDDDRSIDVFDFAHGEKHRQLPSATQGDYGNYKISQLGGGTEYAPVLESIARFYYQPKTEKRLFGLLPSRKSAPAGRDSLKDNLPVFVIFITDGDSQFERSDRHRLNRLLEKNPNMFVQFIGLSTLSNFRFLREIADQNKNAGVTAFNSLERTSDHDLMRSILSMKAKAILTNKVED